MALEESLLQYGIAGVALYLMFQIYRIQSKTYSCHLTDLHKDNEETHTLLKQILEYLRKRA